MIVITFNLSHHTGPGLATVLVDRANVMHAYPGVRPVSLLHPTWGCLATHGDGQPHR